MCEIGGFRVVDERDVVDGSRTRGQSRCHGVADVPRGNNGAFDGVAAEKQQVVLPGNAALVREPLRGIVHAAGDDVDQLGIAAMVSSFQHVGREQFGTVFKP